MKDVVYILMGNAQAVGRFILTISSSLSLSSFLGNHSSVESLGHQAKSKPIQTMQPSASTRLRSACDVCHQSKVKCSGGNPCRGCQKIGIACNYSSSNQNGRPRGVKNKKTIQRMQAAANAARENASRNTMQHTPPGSTSSDNMIESLVDLGTSMADPDEVVIGMVSAT